VRPAHLGRTRAARWALAAASARIVCCAEEGEGNLTVTRAWKQRLSRSPLAPRPQTNMRQAAAWALPTRGGNVRASAM